MWWRFEKRYSKHLIWQYFKVNLIEYSMWRKTGREEKIMKGEGSGTGRERERGILKGEGLMKARGENIEERDWREKGIKVGTRVIAERENRVWGRKRMASGVMGHWYYISATNLDYEILGFDYSDFLSPFQLISSKFECKLHRFGFVLKITFFLKY